MRLMPITHDRATASEAPTADEVLATLPWKWHTQGAIFIIGGLGFMFDAWDVALNGFLIPLLSDHWNLTIGQAAWIATANLIGMALGAVVWGGIADRIGRKRAFTLTLLFFSLFTIAGAFAPNIGLFLAFRFLAGFGLGGAIPVDYALVGEFTPRKHRGRVLTAMDGWWPIGVTLCAFVSAWILDFGDWRHIMLVMVLPALLIVFVRLFIPESPKYLMAAGRQDEADAVLTRLIERTGSPVTEWRHDAIEPLPPRKGLGESLSAASGQIAELWRYSARITITAWLLFVSVLLLYYAALTWLPKILREQGLGDQAAFLLTGQMTAIGILGVIVSVVLIETTGRKWMLGTTSLVAAAALVVFAISLGQSGAELNLLAKVSILAFGFFIQMAVPALYTYVSELYPTRLRGSGFGWASSASRVATGIAPMIFGSIMWPLLGLTWTFVLTGALAVVAVTVMAIFAHETTGREVG
ncbi:MFS transporter [Brevibacterium luteolum]